VATQTKARNGLYLRMELPLNHSIENIYYQVGQYDRYAVFDFYFNSNAHKTYGNTVHGLIIYTPAERLILEEAIQPGNASNNDGQIHLDASLKDDILNNKLRIEGFRASDVARLSAVDSGPIRKAYGVDGVKEIPNTITINFTPSFEGPFAQELLNFENRIRDGLPLIPYEQRKYLSLKFLTNPSHDLLEEVRNDLIDIETGKFYNDVTITWYGYYHNIVDKENEAVIQILTNALNKRRAERIYYITQHLGISTKLLDNLKEKNPNSWKQLINVIINFEPCTLEIWGWTHPVWWNFERFIHIYLRHYKDFFIEGSSKGQGTGFQYHYRDIRRLICIVIRNNQADIEKCLINGKPFNKYGEQGYYYNGNYYTFKIEKDGRLTQFHPQEQ
jgi:hypothetical protein